MSDKKKTAIRQLEVDVKKLQERHMRPELLDDVINLIHFYLPVEQAHIELAYATGEIDSSLEEHGSPRNHVSSLTYYQNTYGK